MNDFTTSLIGLLGTAFLFFTLGVISALQIRGDVLFKDCVTKQEMTLEGHDFTCALKEPKP